MNFLRILLAAVLLPPVIALAWSFLIMVAELGRETTGAIVPFWLGLGGYFLFEAVFRRPMRTYVFGHELTHALAGILSGARLKKFRVSASGGSVTLTRNGVWIALAPYFLPVYTVFLVGIYWTAGQFWPVERFYPYFLFLTGFSLSFHLSLTQYALAQGQSDLREFGVFFSGVVILAAGFVVVTGILKLVFPGHVLLGEYYRDAGVRTLLIAGFARTQVLRLWTSFRGMS